VLARQSECGGGSGEYCARESECDRRGEYGIEFEVRGWGGARSVIRTSWSSRIFSSAMVAPR